MYMTELTEMQRRFVDEYLVDLNATQAAIRAGYSPKTASEQSSRLMSNKKIKAAVEEARAELSRRTGVNQERVIRELARVAFLNATDVINMTDATIADEANRDDTAAIASVRVKKIPTEVGTIEEREIKVADKLKALELLGKHLGMFADNINLSGEMGVQIINDIPKNTG
jgi:phage terminase small subunit